MKKKIQVGIIEDHELMREGMVALLKEEEGLNLLFDVGEDSELLNKLEKCNPDVLLLDIALQKGKNGNILIELIREKYPDIKVIVISIHYTNSYITEMISKGARAFLPKNCKIEEVVDTIYKVYEDEVVFNSSVATVLRDKLMNNKYNPQDKKEHSLSVREIEILKRICADKTNEEISKEVFLSKRTVEWHKLNIMHKTNSKTVAGLVLFAIRNNIIPNPEELKS